MNGNATEGVSWVRRIEGALQRMRTASALQQRYKL